MSQPLTGNRCGHDKHKLQIFRLHRRSQFINEAQKTVRQWAYSPFRYLRSARHQRLIKVQRQVRSERREAVASVLSYLLCYTNFATLHLGTVDEGSGKFVRFGCQHMADKTGLSLSRIWEALADLRKWGYVMTVRRKEKDADGELVHLVAVRSISVKLFQELGLFTKFQRFQEQAKKKMKKKLDAIQNQISKERLAAYLRDMSKEHNLNTADDHQNYLRNLFKPGEPSTN